MHPPSSKLYLTYYHETTFMPPTEKVSAPSEKVCSSIVTNNVAVRAMPHSLGFSMSFNS